MNNLPKVPVRFVPQNDELLNKSSNAGQSPTNTDLKINQTVPDFDMQGSYRAPHDRVNGNQMFRRYPDGTLDVEYAKHKVVDAIHKVRDGVALNGIEQCALSCCFPQNFSYIDPTCLESMRTVNLKISSHEAQIVATTVAIHLDKEYQYMLSCHAR